MSAKPITRLCGAKVQIIFELNKYFWCKVYGVKCKGIDIPE